MDLMVNPVITDFQQDVNGDIKMLKLGVNKEDAVANIIGQAESAKLDNNKTATINVSTYTEPVEVLPTSGKDGMKKATITLSNIPSGETTLYAWKDESDGYVYTGTATPTTADKAYKDGTPVTQWQSGYAGVLTITAVGEGTITAKEDEEEPVTYSRASAKDMVL